MVRGEPLFERGSTRRWRLTRDISVVVGGELIAHRISIPSGTEFESSVPEWVPSWYIERDDPTLLLAAVVHDVMLERGYDRAFSAAAWLEMARRGGFNEGIARQAYLGIAYRAVFPKGAAG